MSMIIDQIKAQRIIKNLSGKTKFVISKSSQAIGLSRQTYQKRLDDLREKKLITNFTININPDIHPYNLKYVLLEIKTNPKEPQLVDKLLSIPQLRMLDGIFGDYSLIALFIFKSPEEYYRILKTIDNIMAESYFKKYQIIETIKVFKTNGISLGNLDISFNFADRVNLEQIAQNNINVKYNPERFPGLVIKSDNPRATILIFSTGDAVVTGLSDAPEKDELIPKIIELIRNTGLKVDEKKVNLNLHIDDIDYLILKILQEDQGLKPISTYEIKNLLKEKYSENLKILHKDDISQSTIHNRIKKLEHQGIILNYTINFLPKELGFEGKYLLRIKPKDPSKYSNLALNLEMNKNITDLFRIGEEYGLLAIVRVKNVEDYGSFIRDLYLTEEIEDTFTNFVLDELKIYTNFIIF
ncbi:MAG: Lrp/AsnC ligand binding domain-containing protein [Candidatus Thorarchaeota archaeon]